MSSPTRLSRQPLLTVLSALACLGAAPAAQALVAGPTLSTFTFTGTCSDCVLNNAPLIATLVLQDYTPGTAIGFSQFVSFSYGGSDKVFSHSVTLSGDDGNPATQNDFKLEPNTTDFVSGSLPAGGGPARFMLGWQDGIGFQTATDGQWFSCAPGPVGYYGGTCNAVINNDIGQGGWSATPVPEPAAALLLSLGLAGLGMAARRPAR